MVLASQLVSGMTVTIAKKPYRVESVVKVTSQKANAFVKVKLQGLGTKEILEKNFRLTQELEEMALEEHRLEYLYLEGKSHVFLDIGTLDVVRVPQTIIGSKSQYLKEGTEIKGSCFGETIFAVDLPQFLELMVSAIATGETKGRQGAGTRTATLETGATIEVPPFIDVGDVIKVDTRSEEYIQRV
jgi:elongation factor P